MTASVVEAPSGASTTPAALTYNEGVLVALTASAQQYGFINPVIYQAGTDRKVIIDGHHRLRVVEQQAALGVAIAVETKEVTTDDPDGMRVSLNRDRRPWSTIEERRTQAQALAAQGYSNVKAGKVLGVSDKTIAADLEGAGASEHSEAPAPLPDPPGKGWNTAQLATFAKDCGIVNAGGVRLSKATRAALIEALGELLIGAEKPATAAPVTSSRNAAAPVQQAKKPPPRPDSYNTEVKRIERLLKVHSILEEQLKELESLAKTRKGDEAGSLAHAPDWHQRVVAYIEQHEPEKAEKLGVKTSDGRWLLTVMDDLERLGHNCHGKVNAALAAHGYLDLHGREPNSTRYNWRTS